MGTCYITRRGKRTGYTEQLGIYPIGNNGRPAGNVIVPSTIYSISYWLFRENTAITGVSLPDQIRSFDSNAFYGCTNLQSIKIPHDTNVISSSMFYGCTNLAKVELSDNIDTISSNAFYNCSSLIDVVVPDTVSDITLYGQAFYNCTLLSDESVNALCKHINVQPDSSSVFSRCESLKNIVTNYVYDYWFDGCSKLKSVVVKKTNGNLGYATFQNCKMLSSISLPQGIKTIGSYCFKNTSIETFTIQKTVNVIKSSCFTGCSKLKNITIEDGASYELESSAFSECSSLTNEDAHNIMAHYKTVYGNIFQKCTSLTDVSVSRFWDYMFSSCTNLIKAVSLVGTSTGDYVFEYCTNLQEVRFADGTDSIGYAIFKSCPNLKTVYLPSSITTVKYNSRTDSGSYNIFYGCTALEDVQLGQDWNMSLRITVSTNITVDSMVAMFNSLKDLAGTTAKTLTLGSTNLAKLTDEQKAIAINKNWTLA